jgi:hypothetical protein
MSVQRVVLCLVCSMTVLIVGCNATSGPSAQQTPGTMAQEQAPSASVAAGQTPPSVAQQPTPPVPPPAQVPAALPSREKLLIPHEAWNCGMADGIPVPENGVLVFAADIKIDQIYDVGTTPFGRRQAIVVQGGPITGPKLQGMVLPGGLDYELTLANGVVEIEQILVLRTADNRFIYARYAGTGPAADDVRLVLDFEAPTNSTAAWLNTARLVGRRTVDAAARTMKLAVYDVAGVTMPNAADRVLRIAKPAGVPPQPWDYRRAAPGERNGAAIVTEMVALGASQSVGASKRGNRNIIPITGGTLSGTITGRVLPGGADYQNLSAAPTIDARYLWQTSDGEIILVRNAGGFGGLVPTFEARVDGKYNWLHEGKFLSSNPGMGAGGVSLTFYRSSQP